MDLRKEPTEFKSLFLFTQTIILIKGLLVLIDTTDIGHLPEHTKSLVDISLTSVRKSTAMEGHSSCDPEVNK